MTINILGTPYSVENKTINEDAGLENCDGYCDSSTHNCVICAMKQTGDPNQKGNVSSYHKQVTRHELIHAFFDESGLQHSSWASEEAVDWIAIQAPKIFEAFKQADCL